MKVLVAVKRVVDYNVKVASSLTEVAWTSPTSR